MRLNMCVWLCAVCLAGSQAQTIYGLKSRSTLNSAGEYQIPVTLYSFSDDGSQFTSIGPVTLGGSQIQVDGLAYSDTAGLWCFELGSKTQSVLYQIDPTTAEVISTGTIFSGRQIFGAAFDRAGGLWAADSTSHVLLRIDMTSMTIDRVVPLTLNGSAVNLGDGGDIAFCPTGGLFLVVNNGLYRVNTATGIMTELYLDTAGSKFLVGAVIPSDRPDALIAFEVSMTSTDNDDVFLYDLSALTTPTYLFNSILNSYNAGRGDLACSIPQSLAVQSTFETGTDGWTGAAIKPVNPPKIMEVVPVSVPTDGDPNHCLMMVDQQNDWNSFIAPARYLGDKSAWLGGSIQVDLLNRSSGYTSWETFMYIAGADTSIAYPSIQPTANWITYTIDLVPSQWYLNDTSGNHPSPEQMHAILSDIKAIYITADYASGGEETTFIDNVQMVRRMSPDSNADGIVNYEDFSLFSAQWNKTGCVSPSWCGSQDFNKSGAVNMTDLMELVENWLSEGL